MAYDDLAVLTMAEASEFLPGLRGETKIPLLDTYRLAVSDRLDQICGAIVARDVTERHDGYTSTIILDDRPHDYVTVDEFDVETEHDAVASITVRSGTQTTTIDPGDVIVDPSGIIDHPTRCFWGGRRSVTVVYRAGRFDTTADVTHTFKLAAGLMLQAIWRPAEGGGSETFGGLPGLPVGTPEEVLAILGTEVRAPVIA